MGFKMDQKNVLDPVSEGHDQVDSLLLARGWVLAVEGDKAYVTTERASGCQGCHSQSVCGTSVLAQLFSPVNSSPIEVVNSLNAKEGDEVMLSMDQSGLIHHSFMAYGLPLLGLFIGALSLEWLANLMAGLNTEIGSILGAGLGLACGWWVTRRFYRPQSPKLHQIIKTSRKQKELG